MLRLLINVLTGRPPIPLKEKNVYIYTVNVDKYNKIYMEDRGYENIQSIGCYVMCITNKLKEMNIYNKSTFTVEDVKDDMIVLSGDKTISLKDYEKNFKPAYASKMTKCNKNGCKKSASFGTIYKVPIHCKDHKENDEENVKSNRCEYENCKKTPSYGLEGDRAIHCKLHAGEDEIDVRHSRCKERGCRSRPTFGLIDGKANHCNIHAKENEIDLNNKSLSRKWLF